MQTQALKNRVGADAKNPGQMPSDILRDILELVM